MGIIDNIKIAALNEIKEHVFDLKTSKETIDTVKNGFINLIDNTSHLTRNKIGVRVEFDKKGNIIAIPINLASYIFVEEGILLKEYILTTGSIIINDKHYFFDNSKKYGIVGKKPKKDNGLMHVKIRGRKGLYELNILFYQKPFYPYEKAFWLKNLETGKLIVELDKNIIRKSKNNGKTQTTC